MDHSHGYTDYEGRDNSSETWLYTGINSYSDIDAVYFKLPDVLQ